MTVLTELLQKYSTVKQQLIGLQYIVMQTLSDDPLVRDRAHDALYDIAKQLRDALAAEQARRDSTTWSTPDGLP